MCMLYGMQRIDSKHTPANGCQKHGGWCLFLIADVQRLAQIVSLIPELGPSSRVLDVGSGTGCLIPHLQARGVADITAVDLSACMLEQLSSRFPAPSRCGNDPGGWCAQGRQAHGPQGAETGIHMCFWGGGMRVVGSNNLAAEVVASPPPRTLTDTHAGAGVAPIHLAVARLNFEQFRVDSCCKDAATVSTVTLIFVHFHTPAYHAFLPMAWPHHAILSNQFALLPPEHLAPP